MDDNIDLKLQYKRYFQLAEDYLKKTETTPRPVVDESAECLGNDLVAAGLVFPAVNELRYAGFHACKAYDGEHDFTKELEAAIRHCKRAIYDVLDTQLEFYLFSCDRFIDDYNEITVVDTVPDFLDDYSVIEDIKDSPSHRDSSDRYKEWEEKSECVQQIQDIYRRWRAARLELNKLVTKGQDELRRQNEKEQNELRRQVKEERINAKRWKITSGFAVTSLVLTVVGVIVAIVACCK